MQEEIVSFQVAKLAKEKGFNLETHDYFSKDKYRSEFNHNVGFNDDYWGDNYVYDWNTNGEPFKPFNKECYSRPTQSLLQKWLREVHGIIIEITWQMCSTDYEYAIIDMNNPPKYEDDIERIIGFKTYEETLEEGLYEGLKLIKGLK